MMKRMMFLAAGVIASLAFTTASQAGTINITGTYDISPALVQQLDFSFSSAVSGLTGTSSTPVGAFTTSGDDVLFTLPSPGSASGSLSFTVTTAGAGFYEGTTVSEFTGTPGGFHLNFVPTTVPEPGSMALLGIGMTSFLAFRRFFKRNPVA